MDYDAAGVQGHAGGWVELIEAGERRCFCMLGDNSQVFFLQSLNNWKYLSLQSLPFALSDHVFIV